jgi:histidine triad (HIT) family protein
MVCAGYYTASGQVNLVDLPTCSYTGTILQAAVQRLEWGMGNDCVFCQIAAGLHPADVVYESDTVVAFRDIRPQAPTHILIIPRKHIARIADLEPGDAAVMGDVMVAARTIAAQLDIDDAFRLVVNNGRKAGQSVFHIHVHLMSGRRFGWPPG